MDTPVSHWEHEELQKLIDAKVGALQAEDKRLNERLKLVEDTTRQISAINVTLQRQADNIAQISANIAEMVKTQDESHKRIKALEDKDGEKWRGAVKSGIQIAVGVIGGLLLAYIRSLLSI